LSIEGYEVDEELIQQVSKNNWNPDLNPGHRKARDILAARGYYEARVEVRNSIEKILGIESPGPTIELDLQKWYRKLFGPSVKVNILREEDLYGYRRNQVFIRGSRHTPLPREALLDAMEAFFECLSGEPHAAVRAILGHFFFVYIHPYMDGNGRLGRFIMNAMLASGGYPWTIIQVKNRVTYFAALESASVSGDVESFTCFVAREMKRSSNDSED